MKLNPPSELKGYAYDKKAASRSSLLSRIFGWLTLVSLASAIAFISLQPEKRSIILALCLSFFILFVLYLILKVKKRAIRCNQCQQPMKVIDVPWTPEEWKQIQGYELIDGFKGADGNLYNVDFEKEVGGTTHYTIHAHIQSWTACHSCRLYFLNARYMREMLFATVQKDEFDEAKRSLLSDPKAREKLELAYKERLQEID